MKTYDFEEFKDGFAVKNSARIDLYTLQPNINGPGASIVLTEYSAGENQVVVGLSIDDLKKLNDLINRAIDFNKRVYEL